VVFASICVNEEAEEGNKEKSDSFASLLIRQELLIEMDLIALNGITKILIQFCLKFRFQDVRRLEMLRFFFTA